MSTESGTPNASVKLTELAVDDDRERLGIHGEGEDVIDREELDGDTRMRGMELQYDHLICS